MPITGSVNAMAGKGEGSKENADGSQIAGRFQAPRRNAARESAHSRDGSGRKKCSGKLQSDKGGLPSPILSSNRSYSSEKPSVINHTDESSPCSKDSTPSILQTGCTVVWSNAAYRSSNSNSTSSSDGSRQMKKAGTSCTKGLQRLTEASRSSTKVLTHCSSSSQGLKQLKNVGTSSRSVLQCNQGIQQMTRGGTSSSGTIQVLSSGGSQQDDAYTGGTVGSSTSVVNLDSLGSTRKTLMHMAVYREACPAKAESNDLSYEEWVHGPERDIEKELCAEAFKEKLEEETDLKLEEELQSGIAALSEKLASLLDRAAPVSSGKTTRTGDQAGSVASGRTTRQNTGGIHGTGDSCVIRPQGKRGDSKVVIQKHTDISRAVQHEGVRQIKKPVQREANRYNVVQEPKISKNATRHARNSKGLTQETGKYTMKTGMLRQQTGGSTMVQGKDAQKAGKCQEHGKPTRTVNRDVTKTNQVRTKNNLVRKTENAGVSIEEQLKLLKLSPHYWGKNFDWVGSLRCTAQNSSKAPARVVLAEKNLQHKQDIPKKQKKNIPPVLKENKAKAKQVSK